MRLPCDITTAEAAQRCETCQVETAIWQQWKQPSWTLQDNCIMTLRRHMLILVLAAILHFATYSYVDQASMACKLQTTSFQIAKAAYTDAFVVRDTLIMFGASIRM